ncbi:hypothetical protein ETU08_01720 [Apibacter muscae]|uniref:LysM domain-containing protein n=1 Tax=Apibacter muscae TaxID=2509004 RepID=A0A563DK89_9FLAO|nr:hypothetical protein [Apibacter muscae]TWP30502.1 hypothetical protein ETU09_00445 [Apibacter muscae]TWP31223.1 hypothetical protein ETU08_01720 [Apibacter muscae]
MTVTVLNNQSFLDLAVQYLGTTEAAFAIAFTNQRSLTDELTAGEKLILPEKSKYKNSDIASYYQQKGLFPATSVTDDFMLPFDQDGIGEMIININFMAKAKS